MQAVLHEDEAFNHTADLRHIDAVPGRFSLTIRSHFSGAKAPEPRVVYQTTIDRNGLLALRNLIDGEVAQ